MNYTYIYPIISVISACLSVFVLAFSIIRHKHFFLKIDHKYYPLKPHSHVTDNTAYQYLTGDNIQPECANDAIVKLTIYAAKLKPDFIVGINRGGCLVGAWICLQLGIADGRFIKFSVPLGKNEIDPDLSYIRGKILLIDDILRTGNTMEKAIEYIKPKSVDIYSATLFCVENEYLNNMLISFCAYRIRNEKALLPWSNRANFNNKASAELKLIEFSELDDMNIDDMADTITRSIFNKSSLDGICGEECNTDLTKNKSA